MESRRCLARSFKPPSHQRIKQEEVGQLSPGLGCSEVGLPNLVQEQSLLLSGGVQVEPPLPASPLLLPWGGLDETKMLPRKSCRNYSNFLTGSPGSKRGNEE